MDEYTRQVLAELRELLLAMKATAERSLEKLAKLGVGYGPASSTPSTSRTPQAARYWAIRDLLPEDLLSKLTVVDQGDGVYTVTAEWLGKADWARVDGKVKSVGGTWIRDGKASRWEIPTP